MKYNKDKVQFSRELRKNMTPWERKLWFEFLRNYRIKFRRQQPIHDYILDFYSVDLKLSIELDGSGHYEDDKIKYDKEREEYLQKLGIKTLRIPNNYIDESFDEVCEYIDNYILENYGK